MVMREVRGNSDHASINITQRELSPKDLGLKKLIQMKSIQRRTWKIVSRRESRVCKV